MSYDCKTPNDVLKVIKDDKIEIAEALALEVVGGEKPLAATGDDGLAVGRERVGAVLVMVGRPSLDRHQGLAILPEVEDGVAAPNLSMRQAYAIVRRDCA